MATRKFETLLKMLDETQLEQWVLAYVNNTFQTDQPAQRNGRKGQRQNGVDVHAVVRDIGHVGYQSKAYVSTELTAAAFDKELAAAETFVPPLQRYTVVTLNPRDSALQEHARQATLHGKYSVSILALEDLADIATEHDSLRKLLFDMAFSAGDVEHLLSSYVVDATSLPIRVLSVEPDGGLPSELRTADEWINAGMPRRALEVLATFTGSISQSSRCRLECRAYFSLEDYACVVRLVEAERARQDADAGVLGLGAQAAENLADVALADELLTLALARANECNRPDVVAAYLRVHSEREGAKLPVLESFAATALGEPERVATALGDAAANLGDRRRALHWYKIARERKPNRALGVELNEACSAVVVALGDLEAGTTTDLASPVRTLEGLAERTKKCEASAYAFVAFNTLGFAYRALGRHLDAADAWDRALAATEANLGIWVRRCVHSVNERIPAPDAELIEKHATSHLAGLVLATVLIVTGRVEDARPWIQRVLDDAAATDEEREIAHVEQMRLLKASGEYETTQVLDETFGLLTQRPQSVPLLSWAIVHSREANESQRAQLRAAVAALPLSELTDEQVLGLATELTERELDDLAAAWLPRIEGLAFDDQGEVRNREAAELTADLYLRSLRFDEAIGIRERLLRMRPQDSVAVQLYARALYESGDREGAYRALQQAIQGGVTSSRVFMNWAMLALALGHRREAHRLLKQTSVPLTTSPADYTRMMQARALLGVKGHHDEVLAGLRNGFITPDNAAAVFGVGLRRRVQRNPVVGYGTIVQLQIADAFQGTVCIVEKPAPPLPGIQTFDAPTHPWVANLLGGQAGDTIELSHGVFEGKQATIVWVKEPADWLLQQAHELIAISSPERTGVKSIRGEITEQLEATKEQLKQRREAVTDTMERASAVRMPIASLAERFEASAREFLQAGAGWKPTAHSGTTEAIAQDDATLREHVGLVFDPVSVLLLVAIGAESLVAALPKRPGITKHAAWQLFDWYAIEREGRRASAHLQLADDGRLIWTDYKARQRALLLKHWRTVNRLVRESFEIVEAPALTAPTGARQLVDVLGVPLVSGLVAANKLGWALISEEELVRGAAQLFDARSASLHRLIAYAESQRWISRTRATLWLAALIRMGWTWVTFPTWMLDHALRLDDAKRWSTAEAFLGRLRTAEPDPSLQVLIQVLTTADSNGYRTLDLVRLRSAIFDALPRIEPQSRAAIAQRYAGANASRKHQATRKMLLRWAAERA